MTSARLLKDHTKARHTLPLSQQLLGDIRSLIASARAKAASSINTELVLLHWHIGERIHRDILGLERAEYGRQIIATLSETLTTEYGKGFARTALFRMVQCAEAFPDQTIVATLSRQLGWSHFVELVALDKPLQREFYAEYLTELPPRPLLEAKLDEAIHRAQAQIITRYAPTEMADNEEEK